MKRQITISLAVLAVLAALAVAPWLGISDYIIGVLTMICFYAVFAMSWDLLFGYAGEVNFGPSFLIGVGAYGAGLADANFGLPVIICIAIGTIAAIIGGLLLAIPALRLRGPYFGLVTLVAVLLLQDAIVIFAGSTGGEIGLSVPDILSISATVNFYYAFGLLVVAGAVLFTVANSPFGLILQAAGQDPIEAQALGFNIVKHKVVAFMLSALFSGLAGAMLVFYLGTASVSAMVDVAVGIQVIIAAVLGGRRTIIGPVLGAAFLIGAGEILRPLGQLSSLVVAALALGVILLFPDGLLGLVRGARRA
ncbi:MAG: branched-chain amino acid ABC transporter permease [Acidocella sp.]|nr:branched-chain amino acid ABC transporter permease [Acidocella sp.]